MNMIFLSIFDSIRSIHVNKTEKKKRKWNIQIRFFEWSSGTKKKVFCLFHCFPLHWIEIIEANGGRSQRRSLKLKLKINFLHYSRDGRLVPHDNKTVTLKWAKFMTLYFLVRYFFFLLSAFASSCVAVFGSLVNHFARKSSKKSQVINCSILLWSVKHVQCLCAKREHCERYNVHSKRIYNEICCWIYFSFVNAPFAQKCARSGKACHLRHIHTRSQAHSVVGPGKQRIKK